MAEDKSRFDADYLQNKRELLLQLKQRLSGTRDAATAEEAEVNAGASGEAREYGDDAQKLVILELEGTLEERDTRRLETVERALRKLEEGTYGLSDASGDPIPQARLDAAPDALYTIAEQEAFDKNR